jgi:phosphatidylinositol alpha-mannosyltransferase
VNLDADAWRVALVCPYAWDAPGGVQVHVAELAEHLRRAGHEVLVLAPRLPTVPGEPARPALRPLGVEVEHAGRACPIAYRGTVAPIAPSPVAIARLGARLRRFDPDVVHVHEPFVPSTAMWAAIASPAPVVATFHAALDRSGLLEAAAPLLRLLARRLAARNSVSRAAAEFVGRALPGLPVEIVPNGIDLDRFTGVVPESLPPGRRIVWVHRLDPQKGFRVMLAALERIHELMPEVRLIVAGDGPDRGAVDELPGPVRERVTMLGTVDHRRVPRLFAAAEVAVAAAIGQESFGITLVEAMASAVPVVATDIDGYREVVRDGVDGILVPPNDPDELAAAIVRLLRDHGAALSLAAAARERATGYAWPRIVGRLERIYADVVRLPGRDRPSLR